MCTHRDFGDIQLTYQQVRGVFRVLQSTCDEAWSFCAKKRLKALECFTKRAPL